MFLAVITRAGSVFHVLGALWKKRAPPLRWTRRSPFPLVTDSTRESPTSASEHPWRLCYVIVSVIFCISPIMLFIHCYASLILALMRDDEQLDVVRDAFNWYYKLVTLSQEMCASFQASFYIYVLHSNIPAIWRRKIIIETCSKTCVRLFARVSPVLGITRCSKWYTVH